MSTSNSSPNIHFCVETKIRGKRWKITKILRGRNSRLGGFFQKAVSTPGKTANRPKYLYLVSRTVVLTKYMDDGVDGVSPSSPGLTDCCEMVPVKIVILSREITRILTNDRNLRSSKVASKYT